MPRPETPADKIFERPPHFAVRYRRGRRLRWPGEAATGYGLLAPLAGTFRWRSGDEAARDDAEATRDGEGAKPDGVEAGSIGAGGALLLAPNDRLEASGDGEARCLTVEFSPVYVLDCATRARLVRHGAFVGFRAHAVEADERLARLARDLAEELLADEAGGELVVAALVEQTLVHLLRRHAAIIRSDRLELSRAGLVDRRIRRAVELMQAHLGRDLPLEEIAAAAYLSPFHFARLFKKLTGATPHAYLASLRAARARELLAETDLSVTEVGARVGYFSPSHFARAFRQATGTTPSAFRQALVRR
ncbi:MAG TPA: AraC family transcriptional regulator [Pyrinomonadaceae bacterium]|nr:AraC family transcriptional regulator [Pyrinomonadaceae bacterium]